MSWSSRYERLYACQVYPAMIVVKQYNERIALTDARAVVERKCDRTNVLAGSKFVAETPKRSYERDMLGEFR